MSCPSYHFCLHHSNYIWGRVHTCYEAPHYANFSNLLSPHKEIKETDYASENTQHDQQLQWLLFVPQSEPAWSRARKNAWAELSWA
jgi:hypothetical protein